MKMVSVICGGPFILTKNLIIKCEIPHFLRGEGFFELFLMDHHHRAGRQVNHFAAHASNQHTLNCTKPTSSHND